MCNKVGRSICRFDMCCSSCYANDQFNFMINHHFSQAACDISLCICSVMENMNMRNLAFVEKQMLRNLTFVYKMLSIACSVYLHFEFLFYYVLLSPTSLILSAVTILQCNNNVFIFFVISKLTSWSNCTNCGFE